MVTQFDAQFCDVENYSCYYTHMNTSPDLFWDDNPVDITSEANFIWGIANKLRGSYIYCFQMMQQGSILSQ